VRVSDRRIRALVTVYSANPAAQSEPLNGYKYIRELHKIADVKIIAHERDRADLSKLPFAEDICYAGSARFANSLRAITRPIFKESWHLISVFDLLDYAGFEIGALRLGAKLNRKHRFDVAHRITPTTIRFPGILWKLGLPTISGPHNGGMRWPAGFEHLAREEGTVDSIRGVGNAFHKVVGDFARYSRILVANERCGAVVPEEYQGKVLEFPVNGVDAVAPPAPNAGDAHKLLFVGRLVAFKCVDVILRALARLPKDVTLTVVGDGPQKPKLEALAKELALGERVRFAGWVAQKETYSFLSEAGVFVFPSVRESGGATVLDAMAAGLPAIVAGWAGPLQFIGKDAGVALPVESPRGLEDALVAALERMLAEKEYGREIGRKAQRRIEDEFLWPQKAQRILNVYKQVLAEKAG
jgi:glycosyltransferase involved in cell wall biosynthesis